MKTCHISVSLVYLDKTGVRSPEGTTPWKWEGVCTCGWTCLSWQWVASDRPGGALPMSLEHLGLEYRSLLVSKSEMNP